MGLLPPWTMAAWKSLAGSLSLLHADPTDGKGSVGPGESIRSGPFTEGLVCGLGFGVKLTRGCILLPPLSFDFLVGDMCPACRPALLKKDSRDFQAQGCMPPSMAMNWDRHKILKLLEMSWGVVASSSFVCFYNWLCGSVVWTFNVKKLNTEYSAHL